MWALLELVADFFGAIFVQWQWWKWKHDPPLKGDRPSESEQAKKDATARFVALMLLMLIGAMVLHWLYWATIGACCDPPARE